MTYDISLHTIQLWDFRILLCSGAANPNFWRGAKNLEVDKICNFRWATAFCLGRRFSKHKMTGSAKNLGGMGPWTPLATPVLLCCSDMLWGEWLVWHWYLWSYKHTLTWCKWQYSARCLLIHCSLPLSHAQHSFQSHSVKNKFCFAPRWLSLKMS